ncbi:Hypothetical protein EUBELI_00772 [Lachnospira eligens ATCC 27750]|uniref:Uncharacterized protein n=1 Tax=Lachnospira eligens (strain ATCC 27750 / DSM 3376 / VPI C15-48 / C15-B4) TaxID=515620 RepID=C4Z576_LACE2|nr:Hypothetical protein EUBELI_00772 [[Eubacterium] eligens ATCC 27750]
MADTLINALIILYNNRTARTNSCRPGSFTFFLQSFLCQALV